MMEYLQHIIIHPHIPIWIVYIPHTPNRFSSPMNSSWYRHGVAAIDMPALRGSLFKVRTSFKKGRKSRNAGMIDYIPRCFLLACCVHGNMMASKQNQDNCSCRDGSIIVKKNACNVIRLDSFSPPVFLSHSAAFWGIRSYVVRSLAVCHQKPCPLGSVWI